MKTHSLTIALALAWSAGCGDSSDEDPDSAIDGGVEDSASDTTEDTGSTGTADITDQFFTGLDPDCEAYVGVYTATVNDVMTMVEIMASVTISADEAECTISSTGIPNHSFNDTGMFATAVGEVSESYVIVRDPQMAGTPTPLSLQYDNGVFLNGVKLDELAAACYGVGTEPLGQERIGCMQEGTPWRYDPMFAGNSFGTDSHNAHTQPTGAYHYHGDPRAMYDDSGSSESGVIGFAADGFPIHGPWIDDDGTIRRVRSGYVLREGARESQTGEGAFPAGDYDGTFVDDHEFTDAGDLDECNGMVRNGSYGYYVTDEYPWVIGCFRGTPHDSFRKMR